MSEAKSFKGYVNANNIAFNPTTLSKEGKEPDTSKLSDTDKEVYAKLKEANLSQYLHVYNSEKSGKSFLKVSGSFERADRDGQPSLKEDGTPRKGYFTAVGKTATIMLEKFGAEGAEKSGVLSVDNTERDKYLKPGVFKADNVRLAFTKSENEAFKEKSEANKPATQEAAKPGRKVEQDEIAF